MIKKISENINLCVFLGQRQDIMYNIQITTTRQGNPALYFNGNTYNYILNLKNRNKWICQRAGCTIVFTTVIGAETYF